MFNFTDQRFTRFMRSKRRQKHMTQADVSEATGISRVMVRNLELEKCVPTLAQLEALGRVLGFDVSDVLSEEQIREQAPRYIRRNIAVAGAGKVGLPLALLLARQNCVELVNARPESVAMLNTRADLFCADGERKGLPAGETPGLTIAADGEAAYVRADYVFAAVGDGSDTLAVERMAAGVMRCNPQAIIAIDGCLPCGFARRLRERTGNGNFFSTNVSYDEGRAHPIRVEITCDEGTEAAAQLFVELLKQAAGEDSVETAFTRFADGETENRQE